MRPRAALDDDLAMMPPTAAALAEVAGAPDVASVLAAPRQLRPVLPSFVLDGTDSVALRVPGA